MNLKKPENGVTNLTNLKLNRQINESHIKLKHSYVTRC